MFRNLKSLALWTIPDPLIQWVCAGLALLSVLSSAATILGAFDSPWFEWLVLVCSIVGLIGPFAYFRDVKKRRFVAVLLAMVAGLCFVGLLLDISRHAEAKASAAVSST